MAKISSPTPPDWSQLPEELLHLISKNLDNYCFDVVHARSVCHSWRSSIPFPSFLLRPSYSLPSIAEFPCKSKEMRTLEKIPLFLFRVLAPAAASPSEYFLGKIGRDESDEHMELLPSPLQCSVKVKIPGSDPTLMNMLDCQILSLGHKYKMIGLDHQPLAIGYQGVAFLPLNEGGGEFVVLRNYNKVLLVLTSAEMKWKQLQNIPDAICSDIATYRGRFYATFHSGEIVVIDPYSLEVNLLLPSPQEPLHYLVPSSNDELFLVEVIFPVLEVIVFSQFTCRVSRLDEKAGKWVEVIDLGDRVLFIGQLGNFSCSAKELPHGCGLSRNSILFTHGLGNVTFPFKYGVHTGNAEDDLNCWRSSRKNRVVILNKSYPVITLRVER
ncbi:hypothetical protein CARUB_v10024991mg [Capsella rubella]|uniref:F-box domain-containing protein n=1 Tax=Capsella rubella TaxID=81985 RepID=R0HGE7_9BRAS|nr:F-box/kelch-repeat protein At1g64840 [Capsella rubella]EOA28759.1 hypothetical protein CARUB_v10024991mg [Capsella rubella]